MRGRPTSAELFDAIYAAMAAQGRGSELFGDAREAARLFAARSLISDMFPVWYFEFPLMGEPALDLLAIYERIPAGSRFAPGGGYGYQGAFDWFGKLDVAQRAAMGIELDLSQGVTDQAGIYFQQRGGLTLLRAFLDVVGQERRADGYLQMQRRMPRGWPPAYVGLFPTRVGSPMRLGGYLSEPSRRRCAEMPAFLASRFDAMGFAAYDGRMIEQCATLMGLSPAVDFQFDLAPDGTLTDVFGLSLSFGRCKPREVEACFACGYGAQVMETLQGWGLADERWRLIPQATFAKGLTYEGHDGHKGKLAVCVRLNYAKVKFAGGVPQVAKFYLAAMVR